jgi:Ca2+-binding RTX toxin-like protein
MAVIYGTPGSDPDLTGTGESDYIIGFGGDDTLHGNEGNDFLYGDFFYTGSGDDHLFGDAGNDVIAGGRGADTFYFGVDSGNDIVPDLNPSEGDKIALLGVTYSNISYNEALNATTLYFTPEGNDPPGEDTVTFTDATPEDVLAALAAYDLIG